MPSHFDLHDAVARLDVESDFGHEKSYEWLRDVAMLCFNPPDDDAAEEEIVARSLIDAADFIAAQPCWCSPADIADHDPCPRCRVLGQIGKEPVSR